MHQAQMEVLQGKTDGPVLNDGDLGGQTSRVAGTEI
jgi:hypothetical protein